jgi:uncharacterized protein
MKRVAIVGSGISGLSVAHALSGHADITLFEANDYFGGHTHTVDVTLPDASGKTVTHGVDTGFLVFNDRTYPNLIALFDQLKIAVADSDMSFSVQVPSVNLEWSGSNLSTVFAQRGNLLKPKFLLMLWDLLRFNREATRIAEAGGDAGMNESLAAFLKRGGYSKPFINWYLLPMIGCIWSCPTQQMLEFPIATLIRFCSNHGLIAVTNRPQWRTVRGGAKHYVEAILKDIGDARLNSPVELVERAQGGVRVVTESRAETFDHVVLACHTDQSLKMLRAPTDAQRRVLSAIKYQPNTAVLHTDASVMPKTRSAWAAWNYERAGNDTDENARVCLHYWLNQLQPLPFAQDVVVSLNPTRAIDPSKVLGTYEYDHPVFDLVAMQAQRELPSIQGHDGIWFAGAWGGYGFHEDGLKSGLAVARALLPQLAKATQGEAIAA